MNRHMQLDMYIALRMAMATEVVHIVSGRRLQLVDLGNGPAAHKLARRIWERSQRREQRDRDDFDTMLRLNVLNCFWTPDEEFGCMREQGEAVAFRSSGPDANAARALLRRHLRLDDGVVTCEVASWREALPTHCGCPRTVRPTSLRPSPPRPRHFWGPMGTNSGVRFLFLFSRGGHGGQHGSQGPLGPLGPRARVPSRV